MNAETIRKIHEWACDTTGLEFVGAANALRLYAETERSRAFCQMPPLNLARLNDPLVLGDRA